MEFEKLIKERYSVRNFQPPPLPREVIHRILEAGNAAPTGCNLQPYRLLVLDTPEALEKLKDCTRCHFGAPFAILVCSSTSESWKRPYDGALAAPVDGSIVATHMMLSAHDQGVGCCWVMHFNPVPMRQAFRIPEDLEPLALLVMGYPAENAAPRELHFKRRPLEETVVYGSF